MDQTKRNRDVVEDEDALFQREIEEAMRLSMQEHRAYEAGTAPDDAAFQVWIEDEDTSRASCNLVAPPVPPRSSSSNEADDVRNKRLKYFAAAATGSTPPPQPTSAQTPPPLVTPVATPTYTSSSTSSASSVRSGWASSSSSSSLSSSSSGHSSQLRKAPFESGGVYLNQLRGQATILNHQAPVPTVDIAALIDRDNLKQAFLSAFDVDSDDFVRSLIPSHVPLIMFMHGKTEKRIQVSDNWTVVVPPLPANYGVFHTKLMLLNFGHYLRVVIGSANLSAGEQAFLDQVSYVHDFYLKSGAEPKGTSLFGQELEEYLVAIKVPANLVKLVQRFDLTTSKAHIVGSIPGTFTGADANKYGMNRLGEAVRKVAPTDPGSRLNYLCSSLGNLTPKYLWDFYRAIYPAAQASTTSSAPVGILYPSFNTVITSAFGKSAAGILCLSSDTFNKPTFPKDAFRDPESKRRTLMHAKILCPDSPNPAWFYIGSHNFSIAAWGRPKAREPGMIINNYELGVVFATKDMPFAVPYRYPPKPYKDTGSTPYLASFQRDHGARGSKAEDDAAGFENI